VNSNFKISSNETLIAELKTLVENERQTLIKIIDCLHEVESRRLHLEMAYPSLFDFCVKELGYSESAAYRRVSAMRLIKEVPTAREQIESGKISLSVATQTQIFFKKLEKRQKPMNKETKLQMLKSLENSSSRNCEKILIAIEPSVICKDHVKLIDENHVEIRMTVSNDFMNKIERMKNLVSHTANDASIKEVLAKAVEFYLIKKDPLSLNSRQILNSKRIESTSDVGVARC
jgi:hypothetical protein